MIDTRQCCGKQTKVFNGRPSTEGFRRRRKCEVCGKRFSTLEMRVDDGAIKRDLEWSSRICENLLDLSHEEWQRLDSLVEAIRRKPGE